MSSAPPRTIRISYDIVIPPGASAPAPSTAASSASALEPHGEIFIAVGSAHGLPAALDAARSAMNNLLTQWKDSIGEMEKGKEATAIRVAEENRQKVKAERAKANTAVEANGDEEDEDGEDAEEADS